MEHTLLPTIALALHVLYKFSPCSAFLLLGVLLPHFFHGRSVFLMIFCYNPPK